MAKVTERYAESSEKLVVICDFSPPRSGDPQVLDAVKGVKADFICVAYNPGKSVRADSTAVSAEIKHRNSQDVLLTLGTRDMNRVALQSRLLGAQMLGLENVFIVQGDHFTERDLEGVKAVNDFTPTGLIEATRHMNEGVDYRGLKLRAPTDFCIGASLDLGRGVEREAALARQKVAAGAQFFIAQPVYDLAEREQFLEVYSRGAGEELTHPVFWGFQVLVQDGIFLGDVPLHILRHLEDGKDGVTIALELLNAFAEEGIRSIYLIPPILKSGARDYEAAQRVLEAVGG